MTATTAHLRPTSARLGGRSADLHAAYTPFLCLAECRSLRTLCRAADVAVSVRQRDAALEAIADASRAMTDPKAAAPAFAATRDPLLAVSHELFVAGVGGAAPPPLNLSAWLSSMSRASPFLVWPRSSPMAPLVARWIAEGAADDDGGGGDGWALATGPHDIRGFFGGAAGSRGDYAAVGTVIDALFAFLSEYGVVAVPRSARSRTSAVAVAAVHRGVCFSYAYGGRGGADERRRRCLTLIGARAGSGALRHDSLLSLNALDAHTFGGGARGNAASRVDQHDGDDDDDDVDDTVALGGMRSPWPALTASRTRHVVLGANSHAGGPGLLSALGDPQQRVDIIDASAFTWSGGKRHSFLRNVDVGLLLTPTAAPGSNAEDANRTDIYGCLTYGAPTIEHLLLQTPPAIEKDEERSRAALFLTMNLRQDTPAPRTLTVGPKVRTIGSLKSRTELCRLDLGGALSLKHLPDHCVRDCKHLASLTLPPSLESIGDAAFFGCGLVELHLDVPQSQPLTIGSRAFADNTALTAVTLPGGLVRLGNSCFSGCGRLAAVDFSAATRLTALGQGIFDRCDAFTGTVDLTRCTSLRTIPPSCDSGGSPSSSRVWALPDTVTTLGACAFATLPIIPPSASVTSAEGAFAAAPPDGSGAVQADPLRVLPTAGLVLRAIPPQCFRGRANLRTFDSEVDVRSVGHEAFLGCRAFEPEALLNNPVQSIDALGVAAFEGTALECLAVGRPGAWTVSTIPRRCFAASVALESVDLRGATQVTALGQECFADCIGMDSVQLPASLEVIGDGCFRGAPRLADVDLSRCRALRIIGRGAFEGCGGLKRVDMGTCARLERVGLRALGGCSHLEEVRVPQAVLDRGDVIPLGRGPEYIPGAVVVGVVNGV